ncbi:uncharacterized protein PSFLO_02669 [Pseudozyma flocculosa]|uniref:Uncharacterized protein n=1 Tax=Pseudozyma flocculosa TaxID=84751 RepID=A0A5C3F0I1_9BASI|nr:uncharacterized protein PSFLO_02669 [Pseudozyma flocculosa]
MAMAWNLVNGVGAKRGALLRNPPRLPIDARRFVPHRILPDMAQSADGAAAAGDGCHWLRADVRVKLWAPRLGRDCQRAGGRADRAARSRASPRWGCAATPTDLFDRPEEPATTHSLTPSVAKYRYSRVVSSWRQISEPGGRVTEASCCWQPCGEAARRLGGRRDDWGAFTRGRLATLSPGGRRRRRGPLGEKAGATLGRTANVGRLGLVRCRPARMRGLSQRSAARRGPERVAANDDNGLGGSSVRRSRLGRRRTEPSRTVWFRAALCAACTSAARMRPQVCNGRILSAAVFGAPPGWLPLATGPLLPDPGRDTRGPLEICVTGTRLEVALMTSEAARLKLFDGRLPSQQGSAGRVNRSTLLAWRVATNESTVRDWRTGIHSRSRCKIPSTAPSSRCPFRRISYVGIFQDRRLARAAGGLAPRWSWWGGQVRPGQAGGGMLGDAWTSDMPGGLVGSKEAHGRPGALESIWAAGLFAASRGFSEIWRGECGRTGGRPKVTESSDGARRGDHGRPPPPLGACWRHGERLGELRRSGARHCRQTYSCAEAAGLQNVTQLGQAALPAMTLAPGPFVGAGAGAEEPAALRHYGKRAEATRSNQRRSMRGVRFLGKQASTPHRRPSRSLPDQAKPATPTMPRHASLPSQVVGPPAAPRAKAMARWLGVVVCGLACKHRARCELEGDARKSLSTRHAARHPSSPSRTLKRDRRGSSQPRRPAQDQGTVSYGPASNTARTSIEISAAHHPKPQLRPIGAHSRPVGTTSDTRLAMVLGTRMQACHNLARWPEV